MFERKENNLKYRNQIKCYKKYSVLVSAMPTFEKEYLKLLQDGNGSQN